MAKDPEIGYIVFRCLSHTFDSPINTGIINNPQGCLEGSVCYCRFEPLASIFSGCIYLSGYYILFKVFYSI